MAVVMDPGTAAREEIRDLLARYNLAGDRGRIDEMADCFCEDGILEVRGDWTARGRSAIAARLAPVRDATVGGWVRHHLTTHRAESESPIDARGWTYFLVMTERGLDHAGRYVDRFRCVDGVWLLAHRSVVVEWRSPDGRFASARAVAPTRSGAAGGPGGPDD
jgi:hypothetical protein